MLALTRKTLERRGSTQFDIKISRAFLRAKQAGVRRGKVCFIKRIMQVQVVLLFPSL